MNLHFIYIVQALFFMAILNLLNWFSPLCLYNELFLYGYPQSSQLVFIALFLHGYPQSLVVVFAAFFMAILNLLNWFSPLCL